MSKHTPGPWEAISLTPEIVGPNGCSIAITTPSHKSADVADSEQQKANAALIAAAPELLAALQAYFNLTFKVDIANSRMTIPAGDLIAVSQLASTAIAKAEPTSAD